MKIRIHSHLDGYRRAGIAFSRAGTPIDTDELTEEQLEAIRADKNLRPGALVEDPADQEADVAARAEIEARAAAEREAAAAERSKGAKALAEAKPGKSKTKAKG